MLPTEPLNRAHEGDRQKPLAGADAPPWHERFLLMLPAIRRYAEICFREVDQELHQELVQETIARALCDYLSLLEQGREHVGQAGPLARYAVAQVKQGRQVGVRLNARDVSSRYCQYRSKVQLQSIDAQQVGVTWSEVLAAGRGWTPADAAAARLDVREWLAKLPGRTRELAVRLALGDSTQNAARRFGISSGRVSQIRRELERGWRCFQGELSSNHSS